MMVKNQGRALVFQVHRLVLVDAALKPRERLAFLANFKGPPCFCSTESSASLVFAVSPCFQAGKTRRALVLIGFNLIGSVCVDI